MAEDKHDDPKGSDEDSPELQRLMQQVDEQSTILQKVLDEVESIRRRMPPETVNSSTLRTTPNPLFYRELWQNQILKFNVNDDIDGLLKDFVWRKGLTLDQLSSPQRPWNRWQYQLSYPRLSAFLKDAAADNSSRSQVICEDLNDRGKVSRWESKHGILDQQSLWRSISTRSEPRRSHASVVNGSFSTSASTCIGSDYELMALSRNMRVLDLSPMVAAMILGSTPRINLSNTAPFLERYLTFCNYAQATLFGMKSLPGKYTNAFVFEYHFAFYFVPKGTMDPDLAVKDFRNIRRSSAFGPMLNERSQWIYEEQLSILLMGQGADVFTTYQLAERYFRGPYIRGTGHASLFINPDKTGWTPCSMFLSWILMALHHVRFRWQSAIEAVDDQIVSPSTIIFSKEDPDLLSDDPQFSRSKTYFWALQAYKMYAERLEQTINTWVEFRKDGLNKLNDGRMSKETWDFTVASIDGGIEMLRRKLRHVREKSQEVRNLREGLFGASALFDSRTTVRQGDNIRLLTYITLLFLPLSFCTSIFGMQVVLPSLPLKVFIITVPVIFVFTAILVFNLQNVIDVWEIVTSQITDSLRRSMRSRRIKRWSSTAKSLHYDKLTNKAPTRRSDRRSTQWSYVWYGVEAIFIHIPVHEVNWLASCIRHLNQKSGGGDSAVSELANPENGAAVPTDASRAARVRAVKVAQIKHLNPERVMLVNSVKAPWQAIRTLFLPVSVIIVTIEYLLLLPFSPAHPERPLHWLGISLGGPPPNGDPVEEEDGEKAGSPAHRRSRKMTIVSIAGSDNVFPQHPLHPSRSRWRKIDNTRESGLNEGMNGPPPEFRDNVFGSIAGTEGRDFANKEPSM